MRTVELETPMTNAPQSPAIDETTAPAVSEVLEQDDLVEDVSIDGMCGVY
jgi:mycofactocin precursor